MRGLGIPFDGIQIFVLVYKPGSTLTLLRLVTCVNQLLLELVENKSLSLAAKYIIPI